MLPHTTAARHPPPDQAALARRMKANGETAATICGTLGIGCTNLYRYLASGDVVGVYLHGKSHELVPLLSPIEHHVSLQSRHHVVPCDDHLGHG